MRESYTFRGTMAPTEATRSLVVDDGRFTHGFIIESLHIWAAGSSLPGLAGAQNALLSLYETPPTTMNALEAGTIAWAVWNVDTTNQFNYWSILDPDHVINQDLFLHNMSGTAFNYLITMKPIVMSPEQGVLQLVKAVDNRA